MIFDPKNQLAFLNVLTPSTKTANFTTTTIDISAFENSVALVLNSAAGTGTTPTLALKAQAGGASDGSDAADIVSGAFTGLTNAASVQVISIDTRAVGKYLTLSGTVGGTTPSYALSILLVGQKNVQP